jgi:hypothetical protein
MWPIDLLSFRRKSCYGFLSPSKIHCPRPDLNPRTLGLMASTITTSPLRATCVTQHTYIPTYILHTYIHTCILTYILTYIHTHRLHTYTCALVALGGLVVGVLAAVPRVRGFKLGRGRWIFKGDKNPWHGFIR